VRELKPEGSSLCKVQIGYDFVVGDDYVASYETAVLPVLAWVTSGDWMDTYAVHAEDFYSELVEGFGAPILDILAPLPTPLWARAARCCFEDFLTAEYEATPSNALDQYLDEVGKDLQAADVDFLVGLRTSVVRVYFVVERTPYESVVLRELSGGARPIQIEDEMLTAGLSAGDNIATRIVTVDDKDYLAGAILVLNDATLEAFKEAFETTFKEAMRGVEKYLQKDLRQRNYVRQQVQKGAASAISGMWVASVLADLDGTTPLATEDDPETTFQATLPYYAELEPIVECLDAHPDLDRPIEKEFLWHWHTDREDPVASLKAIVWISGPDICLESCDRVRIEEAVAVLMDLLGESVEEATIEELGVDDFDDEDEEEEEDGWLLPAPLEDEDETVYLNRVYAFLDEQFRAILDLPVPDLKDQIPRELAKTVKGRKQLTKWLDSLEANLRANADQAGFEAYDLAWMWKELGIETHRQSSLFE